MAPATFRVAGAFWVSFLLCQRSQVTSASWLYSGEPLLEQTQLPM